MNSKKLLLQNKLQVYLIAITHLVHDIYTSFLAPLLPLLIEKFSLTYTLAGLFRVILRIPSLLNTIIGAVTDRKGLKYFIVISPALTAVAMSLIGNIPSYYGLLILLFIAGLSSSLFHVPAPVFLRKVSSERLGSGMSLFQVGGELSRALGPLIVIGAVSLWGMKGMWRLMPAGILTTVFLYYRLKDFKPPKTKKKGNPRLENSLIHTLKQGKILFLSITGILVSKSLTASIMATFLPTYLTNKGKSLFAAGGSLSILQAAAIVGVLLTGTLSDRFGRKQLLIILSLGSPISILLFLYLEKWILIPTIIFIGLVAFSSTPVILALIQEYGFDYPSVANGIYMALSFVLASVMVLIFGRFSDIMGMKKAFYITSLFAFTGFPLVLLLPNKKGS